jgi:hypothetical protein
MRITDQQAAGRDALASSWPAAVISLTLLVVAWIEPCPAGAAAADGRTVVLLYEARDAERVGELGLALEAHLSDDPVEVQLIERADEAEARQPDALDLIARERDATMLVWLDQDGAELFTYVSGRDAAPRSREVPDYGEGWASRCEAMATIIVSELESEAEAEVSPADIRDWLFGIAPRLGLAIPTSKLGPALIAGLEVDLFLPVLERRLVVALDASVTRPEHQGAGTDPRVGGDYEYTLSVLEAKFGVDLIYRFLARERAIVPFVGGGPVLQLISTSERTSFDGGENLERSVELGGEVLGGADLRFGPGAVFAELRFVLTTLRQRLTGDSNGGGLDMAVGYRFVF